jgi:hypothetical protein
MSDNWQTAGTIKSDKEQRGRLRSTGFNENFKFFIFLKKYSYDECN